MFAPSAVSNLCGNNEAVFGLESKVNSELCVGNDLPGNMSKVLQQELFQSMVTGETISVPRKNRGALNVRWTAPLLLASNKSLDYNNDEGQISRRVVIFEFPNFIAQKDPELKKRICAEEVPALIAKCVSLYLQRARDCGAQDFWMLAPPELAEARDRSTNACNLVRTFMLGLSPDDVQPDGIPACVVRDAKCCTAISALSDSYKDFVASRYGHKTPPNVQQFSEAALLAMGFELAKKSNGSDRRPYVCEQCGTSATERPPWCAEHNPRQTRRNAVKGVRLMRLAYDSQDELD